MRRDELAAKELQETLKAQLTKVEVERDHLMKEKVNVKAKEKSLIVEIEKCQEFMLKINEESFYQGIRQAAFYHGVLMEDHRYDVNKDVVNGELVSLGGNAKNAIKEDESQHLKVAERELSVDEIVV